MSPRAIDRSTFAGTRAPLLLAAALAAATWFFWPRSPAVEIRRQPAPERAALVQRTLETLRTTCAHATSPELTEHCAKQAEIIRDLDECDAACRELVARFARKPTR